MRNKSTQRAQFLSYHGVVGSVHSWAKLETGSIIMDHYYIQNKIGAFRVKSGIWWVKSMKYISVSFLTLVNVWYLYGLSIPNVKSRNLDVSLS